MATTEETDTQVFEIMFHKLTGSSTDVWWWWKWLWLLEEYMSIMYGIKYFRTNFFLKNEASCFVTKHKKLIRK